MKLYNVEAKCGHAGRKFYTVKNFPVKATNGKEAAKLVRDFPRVKHHHKDAILSVTEISYEEYEKILVANHNDPYFKCSNIQEQRAYNEIIFAETSSKPRISETVRKHIYNGKELVRNPKKYLRNYDMMERYAV